MYKKRLQQLCETVDATSAMVATPPKRVDGKRSYEHDERWIIVYWSGEKYVSMGHKHPITEAEFCRATNEASLGRELK